MTKKIATMILAGVLATPAMAQQPPVTAQPVSSTIRQIPPTDHASAPMMEMDLGPTAILKLRDALKLTDAQVVRLKSIEDSADVSVRPHLTMHMAGMHTASALLDATTPDLTAYDASVREATNHMVLAHSALARVDLQARQVLTAEQRVTLASARKTAHETKDSAMKRANIKDEPKKDVVPPRP